MTEAAAELKKVKIEVPGPDGANPEVFHGEGATEADAYNDAARKVAEGKQHATAKIHEQQQALEQAQREKAELEARLTPEPPPVVNGFDRDAYFDTLYKNPEAAFDMLFERRFGIPVTDAVSQWERMTKVEQTVQIRSVADNFALRHPEFESLAKEERKKAGLVIESIVQQNEWAYTDNNLDAAYALAVQQGKVKIPAPTNTETAPPAPPATLTNSGGSGDTVDESTLLASMTQDEKRQYYSARAARIRSGG